MRGLSLWQPWASLVFARLLGTAQGWRKFGTWEPPA